MKRLKLLGLIAISSLLFTSSVSYGSDHSPPGDEAVAVIKEMKGNFVSTVTLEGVQATETASVTMDVNASIPAEKNVLLPVSAERRISWHRTEIKRQRYNIPKSYKKIQIAKRTRYPLIGNSKAYMRPDKR